MVECSQRLPQLLVRGEQISLVTLADPEKNTLQQKQQQQHQKYKSDH